MPSLSHSGSFGIDCQVQNITGVAEYGIYFSLLNLSIVFGFLLDWGLTTLSTGNKQQKTELQQQLGSLLLLKILFAVLYTVIVIVALLSGVKRWNILVG
jgi:hypothetical protein